MEEITNNIASQSVERDNPQDAIQHETDKEKLKEAIAYTASLFDLIYDRSKDPFSFMSINEVERSYRPVYRKLKKSLIINSSASYTHNPKMLKIATEKCE